MYIYQGSPWWGRWGISQQLPENVPKSFSSPRLTPTKCKNLVGIPLTFN